MSLDSCAFESQQMAIISLNPKQASPEGQKIFDKLLKACNEVVWTRGESILVLNHIRVDPPYTAESCVLLASSSGGLDEHSLERVKKIVSAAASERIM